MLQKITVRDTYNRVRAAFLLDGRFQLLLTADASVQVETEQLEPEQLELTTSVQPKVLLRLFNGRRTLAENLSDWGMNGPVFGPFSCVHQTYRADIKTDEGVLYYVGDCIYYDGVFYGDWSVFPAGSAEAGAGLSPVPFDQDKADRPPELRRPAAPALERS
jgi:hypothetical protein